MLFVHSKCLLKSRRMTLSTPPKAASRAPGSPLFDSPATPTDSPGRRKTRTVHSRAGDGSTLRRSLASLWGEGLSNCTTPAPPETSGGEQPTSETAPGWGSVVPEVVAVRRVLWDTITRHERSLFNQPLGGLQSFLDILDSSGTGVISSQRFGYALHRMDIHLTPQQVARLVHSIVTTGGLFPILVGRIRRRDLAHWMRLDAHNSCTNHAISAMRQDGPDQRHGAQAVQSCDICPKHVPLSSRRLERRRVALAGHSQSSWNEPESLANLGLEIERLEELCISKMTLDAGSVPHGGGVPGKPTSQRAATEGPNFTPRRKNQRAPETQFESLKWKVEFMESALKWKLQEMENLHLSNSRSEELEFGRPTALMAHGVIAPQSLVHDPVVFAADAHEAQVQAQAKLLKRKVIGRMNMVAVARSFAKWAAEAVLQRVSIARTVSRLQNICVVKAFRKWCALWRQTVICRLSVARLINRQLSKSLNRWSHAITLRRLLQNRMGIMLRRMNMSHAARAFASWVETSAAAVSIRTLQRTVLGRMKMRTQWRSLARWVEIIEDKQRQRSSIRRVMSRLVQICVAKSFRTWTALRHRNMVCRRMLLRIAHHQLYAALHGWRLHASKLKSTHVAMTRVIARFRQSELVRAFEHWTNQTATFASQRHKVSGALSRLKNSAQHKAFASWAASKRRHQLCRHMMYRLHNKAAAGAFTTWVTVCRAKKVRHATMGRVIARLHRTALAMAFDSWVEARRRTKVAGRMLHCLMSRQLVMVLNTWVDSVSTAQSQRSAVHRVITRMRMQVVSMAFDGWSLNAASLRSQRVSLGRVVYRLHNRAAAGAFTTWVTVCRAKKVRHATMGRVIARLHRTALAMAFESWVEARRRTKIVRHMETRVTDRLSHLTMSSALGRWVKLTNQGRIKRTRAKAASSLVRRLNGSILRNRWWHWNQTTQLCKRDGRFTIAKRQIEDLQSRLCALQSNLDTATSENRHYAEAVREAKVEQGHIEAELESQRTARSRAQEETTRERADAEWDRAQQAHAIDGLESEVYDVRWRLEQSQVERSVLHHQLHTLRCTSSVGNGRTVGHGLEQRIVRRTPRLHAY